MVVDDSPSQLANFYCFCSEMKYENILEKQKNNPLTFMQFINEYTNCNHGCGSCIDNLYAYLAESNLLID